MAPSYPISSGACEPSDTLRTPLPLNITPTPSYHVVPGASALSTSLSNNECLTTAYKGKELEVELRNGGVFIKAVGDEGAHPLIDA